MGTRTWNEKETDGCPTSKLSIGRKEKKKDAGGMPIVSMEPMATVVDDRASKLRSAVFSRQMDAGWWAGPDPES
jgi:hypothetical protein